MFGSFGTTDAEYQLDTPLQMSLFMITAILMPLLMMNLLIAILGNTYLEVKEEWKRNKFYQKVRITYELELIMRWNYKKSEKMFLIYGTYTDKKFKITKDSID